MKDDAISRQAAINVVRTAKDKSEAHRMLLQLPPAQLAQDLPKGCTDTISRQEAITEFSRCELTPDGGIDANYAIDFLKQMPPVDAVQVVRCQDCKWYQPDADKWCGYFECMGFEPDDYCSQGERKDGKGNDGQGTEGRT